MGLWDYIDNRIKDYACRLTPKECLDNIAFFGREVDRALSQMPEYRSAILSLADVTKWRCLVIASLAGGWMLKLSKSYGEMNEKNPVYNMFKEAFYKIELASMWPLVLDCIEKCNFLVEKEKSVNIQIAVAAWLCSNAQHCCRNSRVKEIDIEFAASFLCDASRDDYKVSDYELKISMGKKKLENELNNRRATESILRMLDEARKNP